MSTQAGPARIDLISFSLGGYPLALLASQSLGLASPSAKTLAEAQARRAWLLQRLQCLEQSQRQDRREQLQILMLRGADGAFALEIDNQPSLESVAPQDLRPLPRLMSEISNFKAARGFWLREEGMRLLLDPEQFPT